MRIRAFACTQPSYWRSFTWKEIFQRDPLLWGVPLFAGTALSYFLNRAAIELNSILLSLSLFWFVLVCVACFFSLDERRDYP